MFAAEWELAQLDRRRAPRAPVSLDTQLGRGGLERALCRVLNISTLGVKLQTYSALRRGRTIWLTLPGLGQRAADVIWADDFTAGCQFREPLTQEQVDTLAAENPA
ncbi:PilZ domain-containing protein [Sphingomonas lenta]|uniref:Pilus assembly protein PilZ n=1 Tax=Sphingomonas lenta TaxID=1141887 RepID=A0A2A2SK34_9SPHN|nr:PilZ domain-containing protein [Sphingomonas lenta]PAX09585.1 pilus assembly protein PilZ [Sphingomonas lenta]